MTKLNTAQEQLLTDLFRATKGRADVYRPAHAADEEILGSLLRMGYVQLEVEEVNGQDHWYAALTQDGIQVVDAIFSRPKILGVQIEFDLNNSDQSALVEKIAELEKDDVADVLAGLFGLHQSLKRGEIYGLLALYPDAVSTIREMVQAGVEAELMTHEQQRIDQLLDEMATLRELVANNGIPAKQATIIEDDDDSQPIAPPAPVKLKPVLPHTPKGQPKQLSVPQFDLPSDEDDDSESLFVVKKDADAGRRASQNFIESLQKLQK